MTRSTFSLAAIALNRFGLGARPDDEHPTNPRRFLLAQMDQYRSASASASGVTEGETMVSRFRRDIRQTNGNDSAQTKLRQNFKEEARSFYRRSVEARVDTALRAEAPFVERLTHFWANHFAISADDPTMSALAASLEYRAIRPHVLGRFEDMLMAVEQHPAMLLYLDQATSIGPNSPRARSIAERNPQRIKGLNENLAREILELHTLGVRSGYAQDDVRELAKALTGWSIAEGDGAEPLAFRFRNETHEPGARRILGRSYAEGGREQASAILSDLSVAPATARHVSTKLVRHFVADEPPPELVGELERSFLATGGDLPSLYRVLVGNEQAWDLRPRKFKAPWDWTVSALRGFGLRETGNLRVAAMIAELGQPVWQPGSPAGWDDTAPSWIGADAVLRRIGLAERLSRRFARDVDARTLAPQLLPDSVSPATAEQIARAESRQSAAALLLVSPEFMRR